MKWFLRIPTILDFILVYTLGKVFGITHVVRYLRNPDPKITVPLLRAFGASIGKNTTLKRSVFIDNAFEDEHSASDFRHLTVGDNCYIGDMAYFDLAHQINIGCDVVLSGQISLLTHADCNRSAYLAEKFPRQCQPIVIEDGAWIGFGAIILAGVTIGKQSVIAAGSLVRENIIPRTLSAGIPSKKMRSIGD